MIQEPSLVLSLLLASVYAAAFHLWQGRRLRDLSVLLAGRGTGLCRRPPGGREVWTSSHGPSGQVHIVEATVGAFLFLVLARWLGGNKGIP